MNSSGIFEFAKILFPLNRSLTGNGVRNTLKEVKRLVPDLRIKEVKSGTKAFDWVIPDEWNIETAYIIGPDGKKFCDYKENNLHLVGYSEPICVKLNLQQLQSHLYSLPEQPNAIPYVTSYYDTNWGFCISQNERDCLTEGEYEVCIKGSKGPGVLSYGEILLKGKSKKEVFISTYICHPSMANNEVSGICVTTFLAKWISELPNRYYSYRIIFIPETIGSIYYLSRHKEKMKKRVIAGFNVTCIGDERSYSYLPSRDGKTIADLIAKHVLRIIDPSFKVYNWKDRGSDERQYCAPKIDLPVVTIMRTKYGEYPEYHTSLDSLGSVVTESGLSGGLKVLKMAVECLESNFYPIALSNCEPHLSKKNLYPKTSIKSNDPNSRIFLDVLTWSDGFNSIINIAEKLNLSFFEILPYIRLLEENKLLRIKR